MEYAPATETGWGVGMFRPEQLSFGLEHALPVKDRTAVYHITQRETAAWKKDAHA
ncbi:hypothetical protein [Alkalilimnicola ehrlichii]|uniref:hypothetical protein n=1 Tax=Alkalilimnicola ehrlichii TaxID=351052 RepID=UPI0015F287AE|nr:hypothetical protein [Alkalilimnicola ehrlichii]